VYLVSSSRTGKGSSSWSDRNSKSSSTGVFPSSCRTSRPGLATDPDGSCGSQQMLGKFAAVLVCPECRAWITMLAVLVTCGHSRHNKSGITNWDSTA
jgi:hypothetical protein